MTLAPDEVRTVIRVVETGRPTMWALFELLVLPLLALSLLAAGCEWAGGLLLGAAVSLALSRYGPRWWPGRR